MSALRLVLGDQLSENLSSLRDANKSDVILMAEVRQEATYVKHHRKKIAFIFSAMRHFARGLADRGYRVVYVKYGDSNNSGSLKGEVQRHLDKKNLDRVVITEPGEYRLLSDMRGWESDLGTKVEILPDDRFIATHEEFAEWAGGRKELTMEYWYRKMRKKTGLLMDGDQPAGGQWNFDRENRKQLKRGMSFNGPKEFEPDSITRDVLKLVEATFPDHFGDSEPFRFAVTPDQARQALSYFIRYSLPNFGDYQDAMQTGEPFLFHSLLSQYLNCGLLDPMDVCRKVEQAYRRGSAPLNAVEGFIRQIIGWREYIRGIYWYHMPGYADRNGLYTKRALPGFYWDGDTEMKCLSEVITMTRRYAVSHHIQRLMVTGNFANLAGINVREVCDWYLAVYADAYEWVELPNTLGMALYGDGGIVGTKPYVSGGAYINRMSDFCKHCRFDPGKRTGEDACPFTTLYWHYLIRHEKKLKGNPRLSLAYNNLKRIPKGEQKEIMRQGDRFLDNL